MNNLISPNLIKDLFSTLADGKVRYLLLRNINDELPDKLHSNKDIDILIHRDDMALSRKVLLKRGWKAGRHPWDLGHSNNFLYSMDKFHWYSKESLNVDIAFQLACQSTYRGVWTPLDQMMQDSSWENRIEEPGTPWIYRLCPVDEYVHLLTRCIFDKKSFSEGYIKRIEQLEPQVDHKRLLERLETIFFLFSPHLLKMLANKSYPMIRKSFIQFSDY